MALDNFRTQKIIWDRANKKIFEAIEANAGDSNGRKLVVQVINQEASANLSGTTLSLGWKSRNSAKGLDVFNIVDASKGIFEIYYTTEMLSNIGNIEASLILIDSTGRIESSTFTITVRPSTVDDDSIKSENSFTALTEALVKVNDFDAQLAQKATQDALDAERSRIDNLITLPEGATTNDARLEDIKVGADGVVYDSPGNHVRTISEKVNNLTDSDIESHTNIDYLVPTKGANLIYNSDFSKWTGELPSDYTATISEGNVSKTTGHSSGFQGLRLERTTALGKPINVQLQKVVSVPSGSELELVFYYKGNGYFSIYDFDNARYIGSSDRLLKSNSWAENKVSFTIPNDSSTLYLWFRAGGNIGDILDISSLELYTNAIVNAKDGVQLRDMLSNFRSELVIHESEHNISRQTVKEHIDGLYNDFSIQTDSDYLVNSKGDNLIENGNFEIMAAGEPVGFVTQLGGIGTIEQVEDAAIGTAIKMTRTGTGPSYQPQLSTRFDLLGGKEYELSFLIKGDGTEVGNIALYNLTNTRYVIPLSAATENSVSEWVKVKHTITPDANGSYIFYMHPPQSVGSHASYTHVSVRTTEIINAKNTPVHIRTLLSDINAGNVKYDNDNNRLQANTVQQAIDELATGTPSNNIDILNLPTAYDLVVGDKFELFYKGIMLVSDPHGYDIKITGSKGRQYKRKFDFTPSESDVGTHHMTIAIRDDKGVTLSSRDMELIVRNKKTSLSSQKNVLCVGDSLLSSGLWAKELHNRLVNVDGLDLNFIGSKKTGNVGYEGYGGWTYDRYLSNVVDSGMVWINGTHDKTQDDQWSIYKDSNNSEWKLETIKDDAIKLIRTSGSTAVPNSGTLNWVRGGVNQSDITYTSTTAESSNPFWNEVTNQVDFANYASEQGVSSIDYVYILLGWNNTNSTETAYKNSQRTFINKIKGAYPNAKIVLLGLQVPSLDGFGSNYGVSWNFIDKTKFVFELDRWNKEVASEYEGVTSINIAGQFDTEYNMPLGTRPVNNRNATVETYGTNGVHPATSGYLQIADAAYRHSHAIL